MIKEIQEAPALKKVSEEDMAAYREAKNARNAELARNNAPVAQQAAHVHDDAGGVQEVRRPAGIGEGGDQNFARGEDFFGRVGNYSGNAFNNTG